jgi:hypothetical protein
MNMQSKPLTVAEVRKVPKSASMLLCNSCYWCATELEEQRVKVCPACNIAIEAIPLQAGEIISLEVDSKKGVIFEFKRAER